MKDMAGVMTGFAELFDPALGAHLMLAGPEVDGVADDPEAALVFAECRSGWEALPAPIRRHVHLARLSTVDQAENAFVTNALQRHAYVVCQKSLAEGFGLDGRRSHVEGTPGCRQRRGWNRRQIRGPASGVLLEDPTDLHAFAVAIDRLLRTPSEARRLGANARRFTRRHLLVDRQLRQYAELIRSLDTAAIDHSRRP